MDTIKKVVVAFTAAFTSLLGALAVPAMLLLAANLADYATAFMCCKYQGVKFTSDKSLKGIIKKIMMWLLVVVGIIVDMMLLYATENLHFQMPFKSIFACIVAIWLCCNELISILENISGAGIDLPPFLKPIIEAAKLKVEKAASEDKKEQANNTNNDNVEGGND